MIHLRPAAPAVAAAILALSVACSKSTPAPQSTASGSTAASSQQSADIVLNSDPHPKPGASTVNVTVKNADGTPVSDATVTAEFFMPVMPTMPKTTTELKPQGNGQYEGSGNLSMAGSWQVTVTAKRGGTMLAAKMFNLVAK